MTSDDEPLTIIDDEFSTTGDNDNESPDNRRLTNRMPDHSAENVPLPKTNSDNAPITFDHEDTLLTDDDPIAHHAPNCLEDHNTPDPRPDLSGLELDDHSGDGNNPPQLRESQHVQPTTSYDEQLLSSPRHSNRVNKSEVRLLLKDAQSVIRGNDDVQMTRSRTAAMQSDNQHNTTNASMHSVVGADIQTVTHSRSAEGTNNAADETVALSHLLTSVVGLSDPLGESSCSSKLNDEERETSFAAELAKWRKRKAFTPVSASSVPKTENIIGSHVIYKRKLDMSPKARIVPWGHRDKDKDYLRGNAPSVSLEILHLLLSLASELDWAIAQMDIETAYLQALGFTRRIYVRPPREAKAPHVLWRLELPAYGLTDSGRLWYLTSDKELIKSFGLTRSPFDYTLYYSADENGSLNFILAVQVDDYLYCGTLSRLDEFEKFLSERFDVGKFARHKLSLMGCEIWLDENYSIHLSQETMLSQIDHQPPLSCTKEKGDAVASPAQAKIYRHTIGKMFYVGRVSAPLVLYHAAAAATKLSNLHTRHLRALAANLKRLKGQGATLHYLSPSRVPQQLSSHILDVISDGATANK